MSDLDSKVRPEPPGARRRTCAWQETDEEGSKVGEGDYEDVRNFDEDADLKVSGKAAAPPPPPVQSSSAVRASSQTMPANQQASPIVTEHVVPLERLSQITQIPWVVSAGKRPPRDMKRLDQNVWYVVCKATRWGESTALFLRSTVNDADAGFFKPPMRYANYEFDVGDCVRVSRVGYSASRNKIATDIAIRPSLFKEISPEKLAWQPNDGVAVAGGGQSVVDKAGSKRKAKKKTDAPSSSNGAGSSGGSRKRTQTANDAMGLGGIPWPGVMPSHPMMQHNGSFPNLLFPFSNMPGNIVMSQAFDSFYAPSGGGGAANAANGANRQGGGAQQQAGGGNQAPYLSSPTQSTNLLYPAAQSPLLGGATVSMNRRPSDQLSFSNSFFGLNGLGGGGLSREMSRGESFSAGFGFPTDSPGTKWGELKPASTTSR